MRSNYHKLVLILSLLLVVFVALGQPAMTAASATAGSTPEDVPSSHWAYKSVKLLIDKGYLQLYQDQTFQGDRPVDRYTLASIVAKILIDSASGQTGINKDDLSILKSLINEFRDEMIGIIAKNKDQDGRLDVLEQKDIIANDELTEVRAELGKLQSEVVTLNARIENLQLELNDTKQKQMWYIIGAAILGFLGVLI